MVWFGILVNMVFVFPLLLVPNQFLGLLEIHIDQPIWARAAGMLLFIISVFYIPPTWDLKRYRATAWFSIFPSRTFGATFFTVAVLVFGFPVGFLSIAIVDAFFGLTTLYFLLRVTKAEKAAGEPVSLK
jgi:hypothetical protein